MPWEGFNLADITDYVRAARGTLTFDAMNAADALALALMASVDWLHLSKDGMTLSSAVREHNSELEAAMPKLSGLVRAMAASPRFGETVLIDFERRDMEQPATQFAAVTLWDGRSAYAAYRGTDGSLAGWFEDFQLAYAEPVPAQTSAAEYFARMAARFDGTLFTGGHSKGGALALYAGITAGAVQPRIGRVYSFDGPGVSRATFESAEYARIRGRLLTVVPPESTVGMLLWRDGAECVVHSDARGIAQHDAFTWLTDENGLVCGAQLSEYSVKLRTLVRELIDRLPQAALSRLFGGLYELAISSGARTVDDLEQYAVKSADEIMDGRLRTYVGAIGQALNLLHGADGAENDKRRAIDALPGLI